MYIARQLPHLRDVGRTPIVCSLQAPTGYCSHTGPLTTSVIYQQLNYQLILILETPKGHHVGTLMNIPPFLPYREQD